MHHRSNLVIGALMGVAAWAAGSTAANASAYSDAVLADHPVYYYDFNDGTSGLLNQGSAGAGAANVNNLKEHTSGTTYITSATTAGGASLGNAADITAIPGARLDSIGNLTGGAMSAYVVEFWLNADDVTASQYVFINGVNTPGGILGYIDGRVELYTSTGRTGSNSPLITAGTWNHIVIGVGSDGSGIAYLNGSQVAITPSGPLHAWDAGKQLVVGGSTADPDILRGAIDEFAVYNVGSDDLATFTAKIADHYNVPVPEPGSMALVGLGGMLVAARRRR